MSHDNRNMEDSLYYVECCNDECGWEGMNNQCVTFKHGGKLLCPECHEVVEPRQCDI